MNTKTQQVSKLVLVFILLFLSSLSMSKTYAQGPNAPEAAAFEPVDVTDAVNLVTGDFTYSIPTIEIPGPNGGYPMALSYHAGIATGQEASWVGLGWSLNPGAINRNVNGFPDDWDNVTNYEYYWNKGETLTQQSIDITIPFPNGMTIGIGASWGSLRGFSGSVGYGFAGVSIDVGSDGISAGYGTKYIGASVGLNSDGFNVGFNVSSGEQAGVSLGVGYSEAGGLSSSASIYARSAKSGSNRNLKGSLGITSGGAVTYGLSASLSSKPDKEKGTTGYSYASGSGGAYFSSVQTQDDTTIKQSGFTIPLILVNYRKEKVKWYVDKLKAPGVSGSLYSDSNLLNVPQDLIDYCESTYGPCDGEIEMIQACQCIAAQGVGYGYTGTQPNPDYAFGDILEINSAASPNGFSILNDNPTLLNNDGYNISGQGMAGKMSPRLLKNVALVNVNHDFDKADLSYYKPIESQGQATAHFYFDNELAGGAAVNQVTFLDNSSPSNFDSYINYPSLSVNGSKRSGNFVEFFTYNNLPANISLPNNFTQPSYADNNSIVGFRITSTDGIVYSYMLPVYSVFEKSRTFNYQDVERDVYSEKTNSAYATHWLLTSIEGPDYVDVNTNGKVDDGDYGYWVDFEYGKWSEGYTWRNPSKGDEYSKIKGTRRYSWGLKELYYLDRISTRTHTALFIKDLRKDNKGVPQLFKYKDANFDYTMPSQKQLKLNKIVLLQNSNLGAISKLNAQNIEPGPNSNYTFSDPKINKTYNFSLNLQNNVLDTKDGFVTDIENDALKVINFTYDYRLAQNAPNTEATGKLTLTNLLFKGKSGISLVPPYQFKYSSNPVWDYNNGNYWGYNNLNAAVWNLDEIISPQGGKIGIEYEGDVYDNYNQSFIAYDFMNVEVNPSPTTLNIIGDVGNYELKDGDIIYLDYDSTFGDCNNDGNFSGYTIHAEYHGTVQLEGSINNDTDFKTRYKFNILEPANYSYSSTPIPLTSSCEEFSIGAPTFKNVSGTPFKYKNHAGIRVASISTSDNTNTWKTTYEYGVGSVPYEPYYNFEGAVNQSLLRSPNVLYDKVIVKNLDINDDVINDVKTEYEFFTDKTFFDGITSKLSYDITGSPGVLNSFNSNTTRGVYYNYKDYQSIIGNLKSTSVFQGSTLLSKNTNNYKFLDESSGFANTVSTQMYKSVNPKPGEDDYTKINHLLSTSYTKYPLVLESNEVIRGGFKKTTYFDKHDLNSGQLLETRTYDSEGKAFKTKIVPAYLKYPQMGPKINSSNFKNMLTQQAASYTYLLNESTTEEKVVDVEITTWNNTWKYRNYFGAGPLASSEVPIWRIHKNYVWNGDVDVVGGTYVGFNINNDDDFNWGVGDAQTNPKWRNVSTTTMYDHFSAPLETKDINNNYISTKMGDNRSKVLAVSNAKYTEMYYSGAEYEIPFTNYFDGEVKSIGRQLDVNAHTGMYSVNIGVGENAFEVNVPEDNDRIDPSKQKFKVSVWVRKGGEDNARIKVGTSTQLFSSSEKVYAGSWVLLNGYIDIPSDQTNVAIFTTTGEIDLDDFKLCPIASEMTSYVYNEWGELWCIIGSNGMASKFEYDEVGRLLQIYEEIEDDDGILGGFKQVSKTRYNYKGQ